MLGQYVLSYLIQILVGFGVIGPVSSISKHCRVTNFGHDHGPAA